MREIKFRQMVDGEWRYWGYLSEEGRTYFQLPVDCRPIIPSYQLISRDEHGNEIYEEPIHKPVLL